VGAIALVRAVQHNQWAAVLMLTGLAGAMIVTPLADAAISRAAERAADRYARELGAGPDLARALLVISGPAGPRKGPVTRLLDRHPSVASRVEVLTAGGSQRRGRGVRPHVSGRESHARP